MPPIPVPRPKSGINPDRPVNALLQTQVQHLQQAERRLPLRYRSEIYIHAIRTEGEAAEYIREVTEAIHRAHAEAEAAREKKRAAREKKGLKIAAAAARPAHKRARRSAAKAVSRRSTAKSASRKGARK